MVQLDLTKLSKPCLTEICYQLCLPCRRTYGKNEPHVLTCGHHYCNECIMKEVRRLKSEDKGVDPPSVLYETPQKEYKAKLKCPICQKIVIVTEAP